MSLLLLSARVKDQLTLSLASRLKVVAMYSDSKVDNDVVACFFEFQVTTLEPRVKTSLKHSVYRPINLLNQYLCTRTN